MFSFSSVRVEIVATTLLRHPSPNLASVTIQAMAEVLPSPAGFLTIPTVGSEGLVQTALAAQTG